MKKKIETKNNLNALTKRCAANLLQAREIKARHAWHAATMAVSRQQSEALQIACQFIEGKIELQRKIKGRIVA